MASSQGNFWAGADMDPGVGYSTAVAVTPNDGADLPNGFVPRALLIGVAGTIVVRTKDNPTANVTLTVPAGILPLRVVRVLSTGTTATNIVALS
jgi:hypothetical protein